MGISFGTTIGTACSTFAATNIDDLFVLVTFFAESSTSNIITPLRILVGQFVGFTVIIAISMIGYAVAAAIPEEPIGFMGLLPILLGIWKACGWIVPQSNEPINDSESSAAHSTGVDVPTTVDESQDIEHSNEMALTEVFKAGSSRQSMDIEGLHGQETPCESADQPAKKRVVPWSKAAGSKRFSGLFFKGVLTVTGVTVMNGGDNIGVYTPLFSQAEGSEIAIYVVTYYILLGLWCLAAAFIMKQKHVLAIARKYARFFIPLLYTGLGIFIIHKSDCYPWTIEQINEQNPETRPGRGIMAGVTTSVLLIASVVLFWFRWKQRKIAKTVNAG